MTVSRRGLLAAGAAAPVLGGRARAQAQPELRVGVLTDLSGPYQDLAGPLAVSAAQLAVEDFGAAERGMRVEVLQADHQNKADVGATTARRWYDQDGVDLIVEVANSSVALAVAGVARDKNKAYINSGAATSDLTAAACNANTVHWTYDTYMLAKSTGGAVVAAGGDTWFLLVADYAYGRALQRDVSDLIAGAGGQVLGIARYPFPGTTDFSALLLRAHASGAKVLGMVSAGNDTVNTVRQFQDAGLGATMRLAGLLVFLSDVHALGLQAAQGLMLTNSFYWDMNERTRAFAERLKPKAPDQRPTMVQAGVYASTLHYLKVAHEMGVARAQADGAATMARLKATPTDDDAFGRGAIRPDGRKIHPSFLWEVKKPSESRYPWDYYKPIGTTPAEEAFRPLKGGGCKLASA